MSLRRTALVLLTASALATGLLASGTSYAATNPAQPTHSPAASPSQPTHSPTTSRLGQPSKPAKDSTPPGPVTDLRMTDNALRSISLSWTDPHDADFAQVLIRRAVGSQPPLSASDGTLVAALGKHKTAFTDRGLQPGTSYSYAVFTRDKHHNLGTAVTLGASTRTTNAHTGLRGALTDPQGRPIGDAAVTVRSVGTGNEAASTSTDSSGKYQATNLQPGDYLVCYSPLPTTTGHSATGYLADCYRQQPYGYGDSGTPVTVAAGKITAGIKDYLAVSGAISGRITDATGHGIGNVTVEVVVPSPQTFSYGATTDSDGRYVIQNLPADSYQICFSAYAATGNSSTGSLDQCYDNQPIDQSGGTPIPVTLGATHAGINATLAVGARVTGRVTDPAGNPVDNVQIALTSDQGGFGGLGSTGTDGTFDLKSVAPGTYQICFDGEFAITASSPYGYFNDCTSSSLPSFDLAAGQTATKNGLVQIAGAIGGTVTGDGGPVQGVLASVLNSDGYEVAATDTEYDGSYQLAGLPPGQYTVCFDPEYTDGGYLQTCYDGQPYGQGTPVTVAAAQLTTVDTTLSIGAAITGTITDSSGAPISGVQVSATDSHFDPFFGTTDSAGKYRIGGLLADNYQVCFDTSNAHGPAAGGYTAQCYDNKPDINSADPVAVPATGSVTVDAVLIAGSSITGSVTDPTGYGLSSVYVQATSTDTGQVVTAVSDNGSYQLPGLAAGEYTVCFDAINVQYPAPTGYVDECYDNQLTNFGGAPIQVGAGAVVSGIDAALAIGGEVTGTVTDSSGAPLAGVSVQAQTSDGTYYVENSGYTDQDGHYQIFALPARALAICFYGPYNDDGSSSYTSQCYDNQPDPSTATPVTPTSGQLTPGIDARLQATPAS